MAVGTVDGVHPAVEILAGAIEDAVKAAAMLTPEEIWSASSRDLVLLLRQAAQLEGLGAAIGYEALREADVQGLAAAEGQTSTAVWLSRLLRLHPSEAKARVQTAETLATKATDTAAALAEGKLNAGQTRSIAVGLRRIAPHASSEEFGEAQALLLREGRFHHPGEICRMARHIEACLDPDGEDPERAERAFADRSFALTDLGNGRHRVRGTLTDEGAALLRAALDPLAAPRPAVDGTQDPRTPGQRNADALVDLAAGFLRFGDLANLPHSRGSLPHVHVMVRAETLQGDTGHPFARTATGENLTIETVRKIACDAGITPVVVNSLGVPLSVGRESRAWTPAIWAALVARDVGCVFPGCERPAHWCQGHHIRHWINGGLTELNNGALLCDFHHDQVHHGGWQIRIAPDGHPELIPPPWIDPLQQPQRNAHWKLLRDGLRTSEPDRGP